MHDSLDKPLSHRAMPARTPAGPLMLVAPIVIASVLLAMAGVWVSAVDDETGPATLVAALADGDDGPDTTAAIPVPPPAATPRAGPSRSLPDTMRMTAMPIPALVEDTPAGPLPRIGEAGLLPRDAYARPPRAAAPDAPRIAIIVGGLGLSQTGTLNALERLPADVTLAFQPNGSSLKRWAERARQEGHEILLQTPLEPDGYPAVDPGPHTLIAARPWPLNQTDLDWSLGRITAYTGVMPFAGGRFESDEEALAPFLRAVAARGLFFLDQGLSGSQAAKLGAELGARVLSADVVLDADRSPDAIRRALATLEGRARETGVAVGIASAFPASVETIAAWASEAEARGVVLIPARSALAD